jgi:hypothetical protein
VSSYASSEVQKRLQKRSAFSGACRPT